ncbi:MAG: adenosylcobinamide-phosphate synthase CbiB [Porticoccaceae bacterium]|nr:adenosylcobinamide-phosphate synthase CbiB [Porticoccaceae bacterium]
MITVTLVCALALDALLGEPRRWHPLVFYGGLVTGLESRLRRSADSPARQQLQGALGWLILAAVPALLLAWLLSGIEGWLASVVNLLVLYVCIGRRSLGEHARAVSAPLLAGNLDTARRRVAMIVSRQTADLDRNGVTKATVESVLENGSDAVLAPIFWFVVASAPGALLYRLANTLDARWGYRNRDYLYFGRVAARLDDLLNWVPARLCALSYGLMGSLTPALRCWRTQARLAASPNAGPVMAAGAGALKIKLGGAAIYHGKREQRPLLGCGAEVTAVDIERTLALLDRALVLWVVIIATLSWLAGGIPS